MDSRLKVIAGAVALASIYWAYQWFGTATVAITSNPTDAIVKVDGRVRGRTPISRLELDSGSHRLEVVHSHYASYVEALSLRRGDHLARDVSLELGEGTFSFLSNPRGSWVEVDGERLSGQTPLSFTTASGAHKIAMGQDERRVVTQTHTVNAGETLEVNFNLNIDPHGSVTVTTSPRGAKIEFLGKDIEYRPKVRIPIGEYAIRVSKPGYVTQEFRYQVRYGDNLHQVKLPRDYGVLNVRAAPANTDVQIVYHDGGRAFRKPYADKLRVPVGVVEIQATALGHRTQTKKINLANKGATVRFNLEPMQVEIGSTFTDELSSGGVGPQMVIIAAGSFQMGDANGPPSERPARTVTLTQPFAVSKYEVTIGDFLAFIRANGKSLHERLDPSNTNHAIAYVEFAEALRYAEWLSKQTGESYRLLSEAQWEYVARAGSEEAYFFGNDPEQLCQYANLADQTARKKFRDWDTLSCTDNLVRPGPVGTYLPNAFGVYDIYGNVAEWVLDCGMPEYADAPLDGSPAEEGVGCETHGIRGGSWDSLAAEARSSYRNTASTSNDDRGIRLLRLL